ncbi:uncharacterized transposon-derived protein F54H12.3 [Trichonephila clavipes]|nr:uncharacterized transposon-derived protein F54H12.3 [Trichonephila clavipes]
MFRVFTYRRSYKYDDILQSPVKSYNDSKHRSIGIAPSKVTQDLVPQIFKKLYGYTMKKQKETLSVGDLPFKGRFYLPELQLVTKRSDDYWHIEKVLKTKAGEKQKYFVKWLGFDDRFNSWIKQQWLKRTKIST